MKKACVIGGAGFLGSHVCDQLSDAGYAVNILDRVASPWLRPGQTMVVGDLLDDAALDAAVAGSDVVYNFAAIADLDEALGKPLDTVRVTVLGNVQVLEACRRHQVRRYIYASTVYVYSREGGFYRCSKQPSIMWKNTSAPTAWITPCCATDPSTARVPIITTVCGGSSSTHLKPAR